jgi:predicted SAM-dependent methyltransferase
MRNIKLLVDLIRFLKRALWSFQRQTFVSNYLSINKSHKLQIGSGRNHLSGWLNTDLFVINSGDTFLDVKEKFPFENASFDYIFTEHQIEHISYIDAKKMLLECFRVMKPTGKIRIATPDLEFFISLYQSSKSPEQIEYINWVMDSYIRTGFHKAVGYIPPRDCYLESFVINDIFVNYEHQFIYDFQTLELLLKEVGFDNVQKHEVGKSTDINLQKLEYCLGQTAALGTLIVEAEKMLY